MRMIREQRACFFIAFLILCGCTEAPVTPEALAPAAIETDAARLPSNGWLGIQFESKETSPLIISGTVPGSGAEKAGLLPNDELLQIGDRADPGYADILEILSLTQPGDGLEVIVRRDDMLHSHHVILGSAEDIEQAMRGPDESPSDSP